MKTKKINDFKKLRTKKIDSSFGIELAILEAESAVICRSECPEEASAEREKTVKILRSRLNSVESRVKREDIVASDKAKFRRYVTDLYVTALCNLPVTESKEVGALTRQFKDEFDRLLSKFGV